MKLIFLFRFQKISYQRNFIWKVQACLKIKIQTLVLITKIQQNFHMQDVRPLLQLRIVKTDVAPTPA